MNGLSAAQEQIRTSPMTGRTFVEAGAGTGKTRVLISRAHYLIGQGIQPKEILFLAFSQAARDELRRRLKEVRLNCQVQTIHGFALKAMGADEKVEILSSENPVWRKIVFALQLKFPRFGQKVATALEQAWQDPLTDLSPELRTLRLAAEEMLAEVSDGGAVYTFTSLLVALLNRWEVEPPSLAHAQIGIKAVIVDEVQDISRLQARLVDRLVGSRHLMAVGDPWQGIFSFQHATPKVIGDLKARADRIYVLDEGYRCPAQHVMAAEALTGRAMLPVRGFDGRFAVRRCADHLELQDAVKEVTHRLAGEGSVAVLAYSNAEVTEVAALLREQGLPVSVTDASQAETDDYLRIVLAPVTRFLVQQQSPLGRHPLFAVLEWMDEVDWTWAEVELLKAAWMTGRRAEAVQPYLPKSWQRWFEFWKTLQDWQGSPQLLLAVLGDLLPERPPSQLALHHAQKAIDVLDLAKRVGFALPADQQAVFVSTIHRAKGLEWPNVVVVDFGRGSRVESDEERAEGTRVRYVGLTRSSRNLVLLLHPEAHPAFDPVVAPEVLTQIRRCEQAAWQQDWQNAIWKEAAQQFLSVQRWLQEMTMPSLHPGATTADGLVQPVRLKRIPLAGKNAESLV